MEGYDIRVVRVGELYFIEEKLSREGEYERYIMSHDNLESAKCQAIRMKAKYQKADEIYSI